MINKLISDYPLASYTAKGWTWGAIADNREKSLGTLKSLINSLSIKRANEGEFFTLASRKQSKYYIDLRLATLSPKANMHIVHSFVHLFDSHSISFDALGGPAVGAIPIIGGFAYYYGLREVTYPPSLFFVRKEQKGHGTQKTVEGPVRAGQRAIIVEDVTTTGSSAGDAVMEARKAGLLVDYVACIVDREDGGAAFLDKQLNVKLLPLFTKSDFGL